MFKVPKTPKSVNLPNQIFQRPKGTLKAILKHSQTLIAIQSVVRTILLETVTYPTVPGKAPDEIHVASLDNGLLHLITPSAALGTRIRYAQQALIAALRRRKNPFFVNSIKISVRPHFLTQPENSKPTRSAIPISAENGRHIADVAKYIEDEPLRKALITLSKRTP